MNRFDWTMEGALMYQRSPIGRTSVGRKNGQLLDTDTIDTLTLISDEILIGQPGSWTVTV